MKGFYNYSLFDIKDLLFDASREKLKILVEKQKVRTRLKPIINYNVYDMTIEKPIDDYLTIGLLYQPQGTPTEVANLCANMGNKLCSGCYYLSVNMLVNYFVDLIQYDYIERFFYPSLRKNGFIDNPDFVQINIAKAMDVMLSKRGIDIKSKFKSYQADDFKLFDEAYRDIQRNQYELNELTYYYRLKNDPETYTIQQVIEESCLMSGSLDQFDRNFKTNVFGCPIMLFNEG